MTRQRLGPGTQRRCCLLSGAAGRRSAQADKAYDRGDRAGCSSSLGRLIQRGRRSGAEVADQTEYASEKLAYGNSTKT
jgi:hypothetical protein